MALTEGTRLGPYEIEAPIGAGGMGEVYRAKDTRLDRIVAIKVLPSHLSDRPELKERFEREAKAISSLNHPNICALYDVGHQDGVDFLVMEYLEGDTLAERLVKEPIPEDEVLQMGIQIAEALDRAHRSGVVHRDLKPGNVMITREGIKLLDFGLAKLGDLTGQPGSGSLPGLSAMVTAAHPNTPLTQAGTLLGTFQYMAPEQLEGKEADTRSDIFALGAMLYEMATGKRAFTGDSQASLIAAILKEQPRPISEIRSMSPPALDQLVKACLAKNPEERIQTAHDVKLQLNWVREGGSQAGVPAPLAARRRRFFRLSWAVAAVAVAGCAFLLVRDFTRPQPRRDVIRFRIAAPPGATGFSDPRISPDGTAVAFMATDSTGTNGIWVHRLNGLDAILLPGTEDAFRPFWSPDSRFLAYITGNGKVKKVNISGGPPQTIGEVAGGFDGTWGSSGIILFDETASDSIRSISAAGGTASPATTLDRSRGETGNAWPYFLPDGKHFLFLAFGEKPEDTVLKVGAIGSMEAKVVGRIDSRIEFVPPSTLMFVRDGTLVAQDFDPGKLEFAGEPVPVAENVAYGGGSQSGSFSASQTGILTFWQGNSSPDRRLSWVDRAGKEIDAIAEETSYGNFALSPDQRRLAVQIEDPRAGTDDLWILDLERGGKSRFTFDPEDDQNPVWSPDGSVILFSSQRTASRQVYRKSASGVGSEELVPTLDQSMRPVDWSRDGSWILLGGFKARTRNDIFRWKGTMDQKPEPVIETEFFEFNGRISPNGKWMAYQSRESGEFEVYVQSFPEPTGRWQVSTNGGSSPEWRGDGKELYYLSPGPDLMAVEIRDSEGFQAGVPTRLFAAPVSGDPFSPRRYQPYPDGQRFMMRSPAGDRHIPPITVVMNWAEELGSR